MRVLGLKGLRWGPHVMALTNLAFLAAAGLLLHHVHREGIRALNEIQALRQQMLERDTQMGDLALSFTESSSGLRLAPANEGVSRADLAFIASYRGRLLPATLDVSQLKRGQLAEHLRSQLTGDFGARPENLSNGATPRQALLAFALLRVRGSFATYRLRDFVPNQLQSLLLAPGGNCSDMSLRMMMVLESLGVRAASVASNTKILPGHVFVDAYDPQEDTAYLFDPTFSVLMAWPGTAGRGFMEMLLHLDAGQREAAAKSVAMRVFPDYYRFVDAGELGLRATPITVQDINLAMPRREERWRDWLALDAGELARWWRQTPNMQPATLREMRDRYLDTIPAEFDKSGDYAARIRTAADKFSASALSPAARG